MDTFLDTFLDTHVDFLDTYSDAHSDAYSNALRRPFWIALGHVFAMSCLVSFWMLLCCVWILGEGRAREAHRGPTGAQGGLQGPRGPTRAQGATSTQGAHKGPGGPQGPRAPTRAKVGQKGPGGPQRLRRPTVAKGPHGRCFMRLKLGGAVCVSSVLPQ